MSNKFDNFVKIKDKIPYSGKGIEELAGSVKRILSAPENKYTQKIVLEVGVPYIYLERMVSADEAGNLPITTIRDMIRIKPLEEFESDKQLDPLVQIWEMFSIIQKEGLEVGFLAIGNKFIFQKWLNIRIPNSDMRFLGIPIQVVEGVPDDAFVVCGTPARDAEPEDICFCIKGSINETNNKEAIASRASK